MPDTSGEPVHSTGYDPPPPYAAGSSSTAASTTGVI
jgi:hypothetical protein